MRLQWLGTSGFKIETDEVSFLIDPYLARNALARPVQTLRPEDISDASQIFITHGHFDHVSEVPAIMAAGKSQAFCSETAASTLIRDGADRDRIHAMASDGFSIDFGAYRAEAFFSRHVKFDIPLVVRTLWRIGPSGYCRISKTGISSSYPLGQVLSWRFTINGYIIHHFGSAGSTADELKRLSARPLDLLLVPLQGNTRICDIALEYVRVLKPRLVIPHHQDDFYPPISSAVDIRPFVMKVYETCPDTEVRMMAMNEMIRL
ncbi:MAG: MBL fold metallo-hydrolase [Dehalococcoidia bacterium]|jgi:L-ascorbate metabolism protein UlaG (beta-lactamase superfamily)